MKFLELRQKDVVNCNTGEKLGFVIDLEFDVRTGCINVLIVPRARISLFWEKSGLQNSL